MQTNHRTARSAAFGPFEIWLETGELRKHGTRVRLQGKPFQILKALLEQPGSVVTREELRSKLWSDDTYVDFESGLNTAVNRLRAALGDSAESPLYVETLSRIGYRFIAPVRFSQPDNPIATLESSNNGYASHRDTVPPAVPVIVAEQSSPQRQSKWSWMIIPAVLSVGVIAAAAVWIFVKHSGGQAKPKFRQLTFASGGLTRARFSRDGKQIFYSAAWNGSPTHLYREDVASGETADLGFEGQLLAAISPQGGFALFDSKLDLHMFERSGKPVGGIPDGATAVDWSPDSRLWVVTHHGAECALETPPGRVVYAATGWIDFLRVSPDGSEAAFMHHLIQHDDAGDVVVVRPGGETRTVSAGWASEKGLAWSPSGRELWFTAATKGIDRQMRTVDMSGHTRQVSNVPGGITLHDISRSGDVLITRDTTQVSMLLGALKENQTRDISWLDWPAAAALSNDGTKVLFDESGEAGGAQYSAFIYDDRTGSRQRLGPGRALDLSPDGQWALTQLPPTTSNLTLVSTSTHQARSIAAPGFSYAWARFAASNPLTVMVGGGYRADDQGVYREQAPDWQPVRVSNEALMNAVADVPRRLIAGNTEDGSIVLIDGNRGSARVLPNDKRAMPVGFLDADDVVLWNFAAPKNTLEILNVQTGAVRPYAPLSAEANAIPGVFHFALSANLNNYVISGHRLVSTLFDVTGWS